MTDFKEKLPKAQIIQFLESGDECTINLVVLVKLGVYSRKSKAVEALKRSFEEGVEFSTSKGKTPQGGRPSDSYLLTSDCFKEMCLMAQTETGKLIRKYYIEVERQWKVERKRKQQEVKDIALLDKVIQMLTSKTKVNTEVKFLTSFYDILYRKRGGDWTHRDRNDRPGCVGRWTNQIIYDRLPGGDTPRSVKAALKAAQQMEGGRMHHFLSSIGQTDLQIIFAKLQTVDDLTPDGDWDKFMRQLAKTLPNGEPLQLSLLDLLDEAKTSLDKAS